MTSSLNAPTAYVSRWVTIIPMYSTSEPSRMQSQKKMLVIYDGHSTRTLISNIDVTDARAEWSQGQRFVKLTLAQSHIQPAGVASTKNRSHHWTVHFNERDPDRVHKLGSFIQAINEHIPTIMQQQQNSKIIDFLYFDQIFVSRYPRRWKCSHQWNRSSFLKDLSTRVRSRILWGSNLHSTFCRINPNWRWWNLCGLLRSTSNYRIPPWKQVLYSESSSNFYNDLYL